MTRYLSPISIVSRTQRNCCALILGTAAVLAGCGGGSSQVDVEQLASDAAKSVLANNFPTPSMCAATPTLCPETPTSSLIKQAARSAPQAVATITPDQLFDWAEQAFGSVFAGHSATIPAVGFVYRFYPTTNSYVAVRDDGGVYVLIAGGPVTYVAPITDFTCTVNPAASAACTQVLTMSKVSADPTVPNYSLMMYPQKFTVKVVDQAGKPVANQTVDWTANGNGWTIPSTSVTASDVTTQVNWVPGYGVSMPQMTATAKIPTGATQVTYSGLLKTDVQIDGSLTPNIGLTEYWNTEGVTGVARTITPLTEPAGTYYAAMQWNTGYTGIQRGGQYFDRQIQFSVWSQKGVPASIVNAGSSKCENFGHEGSGVMCANTYPWATNKTYRFEMTTATVVAGYTDITMHFVDVETGAKLFVGTLRHAGGINMKAIGSFSEDFKRDAMGCHNVSERRAVFGNMQISTGSSWIAAPTYYRYVSFSELASHCANSGYVLTATGFELGIGGTVKSTLVADSSVVAP